jgi:hypothetical protein
LAETWGQKNDKEWKPFGKERDEGCNKVKPETGEGVEPLIN